MKKHYLLLLISAILFSCNQEPPADFLIQNGTIIDGLGNPAIKADLLIRNGLIEYVKSGERDSAINTIDATGLIVSPGFIDVHNHSDQSINNPSKRLNEGFIRQGVTTIVGGPDGRWAPSTLKELISAYDSLGIGTNVAFYVGHNGIRRAVMKEDQQRQPTSDELNQMKALVKEGMELGAIGLSTGLMYTPGSFSETEEVIELAKEVEPYNGIYDSHVRNPVHAFVQSHREVIEIATAANIKGKLGHLKAVGLHNEGAISEVIEMVETSRANGSDIVSDQYPYDGAQTSILEYIIVIPSDMKEKNIIDSLYNDGHQDEALEIVKVVLADPKKRALIKETSEQGENGGFAWLKATGYSSMRITNSVDQPKLVGKYLSQIASEKNVSGFDLVCELIITSQERVSVTLGGINENDVQMLLKQPWNIIASDGGYAKNSTEPTGHPRSTGTFPRVLGHYARDLKLLSLEEAIRKMTSFPADVIGFKNRGRIQNGLPADITIFNPETIIDNSTFEKPNLYASGIVHVFVNGIPVLLNEEMTGNAPGNYLNKKTEANKK
ncbi:MAG: amidohydrolase family protein [Flavobacteriaceae bacterium]|nr:amidohydrolase family protein [Flavobacteriaceae bacterium]